MGTKSVCILAAGQGSRMGDFLSPIHKALLPYQGKAILSHIFDRFNKNTHFVIAIGHLGSLIVDYVQMAHPNLNVDFVNVHPFVGPKSGPGYSLLCCENQLNDHFIVVCADTLWSEPMLEYPKDSNWLALSKFEKSEFSRFCLAEIEGTQIMNILDKPHEVDFQKKYLAFTGVFFIKDKVDFFAHLREGPLIHNEYQLSSGFTPLVRNGKMKPLEMNHWVDLGTQQNYENACREDPYFISQKKGQLIYFVNDKVIKFSSNLVSIKEIISRQRSLSNCTPKITNSKNNFYSYKFIRGKSFYHHLNPYLFEKFLNYASSHLWGPAEVGDRAKLAYSFYFEKTQQRIQKYLNDNCDAKFPYKGLEKLPINWEKIMDINPVLFHGDLQLDNVIYNEETGDFSLIDWRNNFADSTSCGDIYYDLSKLLASLKVNYLKLWSDPNTLNKKHIYPVSVENYLTYENILKKFSQGRSLDFHKIEPITALIFLNIAPLHRSPISHVFWNKGLELLRNFESTDKLSNTREIQKRVTIHSKPANPRGE